MGMTSSRSVRRDGTSTTPGSCTAPGRIVDDGVPDPPAVGLRSHQRLPGLPSFGGTSTLDGMGAGAPPRMIVGCRAGGGPGGSATGVGGPSDRSAYECRTGCSRPFGRRVRAGCADRGGAADAVDPRPRAGDRLAAVAAGAGEGDL